MYYIHKPVVHWFWNILDTLFYSKDSWTLQIIIWFIYFLNVKVLWLYFNFSTYYYQWSDMEGMITSDNSWSKVNFTKEISILEFFYLTYITDKCTENLLKLANKEISRNFCLFGVQFIEHSIFKYLFNW